MVHGDPDAEHQASRLVEKHAGARSVQVRLGTQRPGLWQLKITDDRFGLAADALFEPASLGLLGTEERAGTVRGGSDVPGSKRTRALAAGAGEHQLRAGELRERRPGVVAAAAGLPAAPPLAAGCAATATASSSRDTARRDAARRW